MGLVQRFVAVALTFALVAGNAAMCAGCCLPPGAHRGVPRHEGERERDSRETLDEPHNGYRMLDRMGPVKRMST